MRVLHVSYSDLDGGAAKAAYRLHIGMQKHGIDSHMLVVHKCSNDPTIRSVSNAQKIRIKIQNRVSQLLLASTGAKEKSFQSLNLLPSGVGKLINQFEADIVNLHWIGAEMLSIYEIRKIKARVYWTMHDMWPFCPTEHYKSFSNKEEAFLNNTSLLPRLSYKSKILNIENKKIHCISPSNWLAACAKESRVLRNQHITVIPNCLDQDIFKRLKKEHARKIFNFPPNKKIILFGAMSSTTDPRKGFKILNQAIKKLEKEEEHIKNTCLVIFGADENKKISSAHEIEKHYITTLTDEYSLSALYNSADVFVAPSLQDNLPNTVVEAINCQTPCIAFNIGGMPDMIQNGVNGYLCKEINDEELSKAIIKTLKSENFSSSSSSTSKYSEEHVTKRYLEAYHSTEKDYESADD